MFPILMGEQVDKLIYTEVGAQDMLEKNKQESISYSTGLEEQGSMLKTGVPAIKEAEFPPSGNSWVFAKRQLRFYRCSRKSNSSVTR